MDSCGKEEEEKIFPSMKHHKDMLLYNLFIKYVAQLVSLLGKLTHPINSVADI